MLLGRVWSSAGAGLNLQVVLVLLLEDLGLHAVDNLDSDGQGFEHGVERLLLCFGFCLGRVWGHVDNTGGEEGCEDDKEDQEDTAPKDAVGQGGDAVLPRLLVALLTVKAVVVQARAAVWWGSNPLSPCPSTPSQQESASSSVDLAPS